MKHVKDFNMNENNEYPNYFTVGDLKKMLNNIPDNLPIGKSGHFGEFNPMDEFDFSVGKARMIKKRYYGSWRKADEEYSSIFEINSPDIGPSPD